VFPILDKKKVVPLFSLHPVFREGPYLMVVVVVVVVCVFVRLMLLTKRLRIEKKKKRLTKQNKD